MGGLKRNFSRICWLTVDPSQKFNHATFISNNLIIYPYTHNHTHTYTIIISSAILWSNQSWYKFRVSAISSSQPIVPLNRLCDIYISFNFTRSPAQGNQPETLAALASGLAFEFKRSSATSPTTPTETTTPTNPFWDKIFFGFQMDVNAELLNSERSTFSGIELGCFWNPTPLAGQWLQLQANVILIHPNGL